MQLLAPDVRSHRHTRDLVAHGRALALDGDSQLCAGPLALETDADLVEVIRAAPQSGSQLAAAGGV